MTAERMHRSPISFDYRGKDGSQTYTENFASLKFLAYDRKEEHNLQRALRSTETRRKKILDDIKPLAAEEELRMLEKKLGRAGKLYLAILHNEVSVAGFNFTA